MKFTLKALSLALVASASTVTFADEAPLLPLGLEFSGSAAMTTDYRFRGLTQTKSDPAIQVGFQLDHSTGLYAGVWGSNVDFGVTLNEDDGSFEADSPHLELDPYIGYAKTFENLPGAPTLDVGVWYYAYPGKSDLNFVEYYASVGFDGLVAEGDSVSTYVYYTDDNLGGGDDAWYLNASYSVPFGAGFGGVAAVGFNDVKNGSDHVWDWKVGATYEFQSISGFSAELAAVGTDTETKGESSAYKRGVETGAVFTLTKSF